MKSIKKLNNPKKKSAKMLNLIITIKILLLYISKVESKYLFVFEQCRHGARSMSTLDEEGKDIIGEKWYGAQELSSVGLRQHYLLGNLIRNKYKNLISFNYYNPKEIIVYSTLSNRTIMSARAQLNGMFKNDFENVLYNNQFKTSIPNYLKKNKKVMKKKDNLGDYALPYNIPNEIPIHIINKKDKIFQFEKDNGCPPLKKARKKNQDKQEINNFINKFNKTFGEKLLKYYNITNDENFFIKLNNINELTLGIIINIIDGRNLSRFEEYGINITQLKNYSEEFIELKSKEIQAKDSNNEIALASSSVLLRLVLNYMDNIVYNDINNINNLSVPKFFLLSAHDSTVIMMEDLLRFLFKLEMNFPSFASGLFLELEKNSDFNYFINIVFNNKTLETLSYDDFKRTILEKTWSYEQTGIYCGFVITNNKNFIEFYAVYLILFLLFFMFFTIEICLRKKKKK